jgi:hypothetical protein
VVRGANFALLKSLTPEEWKHYGMHSERGQETIEHIVRLYAGHDLNHLQQIERILSEKREVDTMLSRRLGSFARWRQALMAQLVKIVCILAQKRLRIAVQNKVLEAWPSN